MREHPIIALVLAITGMVFAVMGPGDHHAGMDRPPAAEASGARHRLASAGAIQGGAQPLDAATRAAGFQFRTGSAAHRAAFERAVADARPEARAMIGIVDGLTHVRLEAALGAAPGVAVAGDSGYDVAVDIERAAHAGRRGIDRVVLHELAHVIDGALVTDAMMAPLQAAIPAPSACGADCPTAAERFAETFARWATGDPGEDISLGYDVPMPQPSLDAWGAQLTALIGVPAAGRPPAAA
jgi:hypothetical protein